MDEFDSIREPLTSAMDKTIRYLMFELNDNLTREKAKIILEFLIFQDLNNSNFKYQIICDEKNNTSEIIENHSFVLSVEVTSNETKRTLIFTTTGEMTAVPLDELI